ncbi:SDR family NAD(P)-dependent oxidoreductase, partial [Komagataeibacter sucrofermentans]
MRARGYAIIILSRQARAASPGITNVVCDLTDSESIKQAATHIAAQTSRVDVLVHCAGIITPQVVGKLDSATITSQIAVDLTAPIELTNALLPIMRRGGHIVFVNSMAAAFPLAGSSVYTAAKFGLRGFARALEQELRPRRIQVSSIY